MANHPALQDSCPTMQVDNFGSVQTFNVEDRPRLTPEIIHFAESKVPTAALHYVVGLRPRPWARLHVMSREYRMQDYQAWSAFALYERTTCLHKGRHYFPPCMCCATQTGGWCDGCSQPLCSVCEAAQEPCPTCCPRGERLRPETVALAHVLDRLWVHPSAYIPAVAPQ